MNLSMGSSRTLSHAPRRVSSPFNMPPQDGAISMMENTMPSDCAQSGSAVNSRLTVNATQMTAMAILIGHSNSAYSLLVVNPSGSVMAAATMIAFQPQKLIQLSASLNMRALHNRCSE